MILWWKAALLCGLLPFLVGVVVFTAWYATRAAWLVEAGLLSIGAGLLLVCVGLLCVLAYVLRARASRSPGWKSHAAIAVLVMLANFPAAAALVMLADHIASSYVVVVENRSPWVVTDLVFRSEGHTYAFGTVPPQSDREDAFHFPQERETWYSLSLNGQLHEDIFDGYVAGWGNKATLHVSESGNVSIRHERF